METTTTGDSSIVAAKDISRRSFAGASNIGIEDKKKSNLISRRAGAIEQVGELNCLYELVVSETRISNSINIALQNAKLALLRPVWDEESWGDIVLLEKGREGANENIRGIFNDKSVSCAV